MGVTFIRVTARGRSTRTALTATRTALTRTALTLTAYPGAAGRTCVAWGGVCVAPGNGRVAGEGGLPALTNMAT